MVKKREYPNINNKEQRKKLKKDVIKTQKMPGEFTTVKRLNRKMNSARRELEEQKLLMYQFTDIYGWKVSWKYNPKQDVRCKKK
jgi:hypothetical protein